MDQKRGDEETVHLYVDSQSNNCGHPPVLTVVSNHISYAEDSQTNYFTG